jgi:hypothetical protein
VRTNTTGPRITKRMSPNTINIIPASRAPNAPHQTRSEKDIAAPFFACLYKGMMPPGEDQHIPTEEGLFTNVGE